MYADAEAEMDYEEGYDAFLAGLEYRRDKPREWRNGWKDAEKDYEHDLED